MNRNTGIMNRNQNMKKSKLLLHTFAIITIFFWSLNTILTRMAVRYFTPDAISFLRYSVAAITLIIYAFIKKMRLPDKKDIPLFILGGAIGFAVYVYAFNMGCKTVMASAISLIISASPFITAIFAQIFLKEKIGAVGWVSSVFAFLGVGVISLSDYGIAFNIGILWVCLATILLSIYNIYQRKLLLRYSPLEVTTYCIVSGAVLLSIFAPRAIPQLMLAPASQIVTIVIMGVFCAAVAYVCWSYALSKAEKTSEVTNYLFLNPVVATFLGYFMIDELPDLPTYIGGALILGGLLLSNLHPKLQTPKRASHRQP